MSIVAATYATLAEADTILGETLPWDDTDLAEKQTALEWATVYMDSTYTIEEQTVIPDSLKNGNALFANAYLSGGMFDHPSTIATGITAEEVKAGPTMSKTEYDPYLASQWTDPYPEISALLYVGGFSITKGGVSQPSLWRT